MENKLLIRASQLGRLMTDPKSKTDKEAGLLGATAKSLIEEIALKNKYGYEEPLITDDIMKGLLCEQDGIALVQKVEGGEFRIKNDEKFENAYISGTPDIILSDKVEDIKCSSTLKTFLNADSSKIYWWQGQAYMWLTGIKKFSLRYCLVPTPTEIVVEQKKKWYYKFNCDETNEDYIKISTQIEHNNDIIHSIPLEKRVKSFHFEFDESIVEKVIAQYNKALPYYLSFYESI